MIDQNLLLLGVFPAAMVLIAVWALFLNRLTPEQAKRHDEQLVREGREQLQYLIEIEERLSRLEGEQRREARLITYGRVTLKKNHKVRPEARAALSRLVASPAE